MRSFSAAGREHVEDARNELGRFARAGRGFDDHRLVEAVADEETVGVIGQGRRLP